MALVEFAEKELRLAGLFDADSDYGGMIGTAVLELVTAFAKQGHSGVSAGMTLAAFDLVARYKPMTPLTNDPDEWMEVGDGAWQSRRSPSCFSKDGGQTYYFTDEEGRPTVRATAASRTTTREGAE